MCEVCFNEVMKNLSLWLKAAAIYNIIWGALAIFFPLGFFAFFKMEAPLYPEFWQCIGMIVGVYGLGYWWAARNPIKHWPITAVGLLGKIFGPIGFAGALIQGKLPVIFGVNIIFNDLIWWPSFGLIIWRTYQHSIKEGSWP